MSRRGRLLSPHPPARVGLVSNSPRYAVPVVTEVIDQHERAAVKHGTYESDTARFWPCFSDGSPLHAENGLEGTRKAHDRRDDNRKHNVCSCISGPVVIQKLMWPITSRMRRLAVDAANFETCDTKQQYACSDDLSREFSVGHLSSGAAT